jgi:hypothetical protein
VLVIQGIFDRSGRELIELKPVFRYPWRSAPTARRPPADAPYAVRILDSQGNTTVTPFEARLADDGEGSEEAVGFFEVMVPSSFVVDSLSIINRGNQQSFRTIRRSPAAPQLQIASPKPGNTLDGPTRIAWEATDSDTPAEELLFQVAYSFDGGKSFVPVAVDQQDSQLEFDPTRVQASRGAGLIRIFVSDGLNTTFADVGDLTLPNTCIGDCNGDRTAAIDDLVLLVNVALGNEPISACDGADTNGDGGITIDELIGAVRSALEGCA